MIQISFQPALDPLHAAFRLLRMREIVKEFGALPWQTIRIADFYVCFPFEMSNIRLAPKDKGLKALAKKYESLRGYARLPDNVSLFTRMEPMQKAALDSLAQAGLYAIDANNEALVKATDLEVPSRLKERVRKLNGTQEDIMTAIRILITNYHLLGKDGLKHRTELMDFRYDA